MSKILSILAVAFSVFMMGCSLDVPSSTSDQEYRTTAWSYIDASSRSTIIGTVDQGKVTRNATFSTENTPSVSVIWNTTQDALVGPITVHLDISNKS